MIERRIDMVGRIVLPKEMRRTLGLDNGALVTIDSGTNEIVIRKSNNSCLLCGGTEGVNSELHICCDCIEKILRHEKKFG